MDFETKKGAQVYYQKAPSGNMKKCKSLKAMIQSKRYTHSRSQVNKSGEAYSIYKGHPIKNGSEVNVPPDQLLMLSTKSRKARYAKKQAKSNKRGRVISQQAIQLVGDKISFSNEAANFATNFHSRGSRNSNFENFISMANYYGTNRGVLPPSFEVPRHINLTEKSLSNPQNPKEESKSYYAHVVSKAEAMQCKNGSIEDPGKSQNNHSPLMTKRKQKGGNSTVRNKYMHHKNSSKLVSLNSNLRQPK